MRPSFGSLVEYINFIGQRVPETVVRTRKEMVRKDEAFNTVADGIVTIQAPPPNLPQFGGGAVTVPSLVWGGVNRYMESYYKDAIDRGSNLPNIH